MRRLLLALAVASSAAAAPVANAPVGQIVGVETAVGTAEFLGVPYATAPRFAPPGPVNLTSPYAATSFGPCCPQPTSPTYIPRQDEQCLNLNVFTPTTALNGSDLLVGSCCGKRPCRVVG